MNTNIKLNQIKEGKSLLTNKSIVNSDSISINKINASYEIGSGVEYCFNLNNDEIDSTRSTTLAPYYDTNTKKYIDFIYEYTDDNPWYPGIKSAILVDTSTNQYPDNAFSLVNYQGMIYPGSTGDYTAEFRFCQDASSLQSYITFGGLSFKFKEHASGLEVKADYSIVAYDSNVSIAGQWHHYAVTRKSGKLSLYIDGVRVYVNNSYSGIVGPSIAVSNKDPEHKNKYASVVFYNYARWDDESFEVPDRPYVMVDDKYQLESNGTPVLTPDLESGSTGELVKDIRVNWEGTKAEYDELVANNQIHDDWYYRITDDVEQAIATNVLKIVLLTQEEFDALTPEEKAHGAYAIKSEEE